MRCDVSQCVRFLYGFHVHAPMARGRTARFSAFIRREVSAVFTASGVLLLRCCAVVERVQPGVGVVGAHEP